MEPYFLLSITCSNRGHRRNISRIIVAKHWLNPFYLSFRSCDSCRRLPEPKHHSFLFNPLNAELNPICCLLALLGAHHFLHVSRIRVKSLTLRLLMSYIYIYIYIYIYGAPILDVSRSHTTTYHSG